MSIINNIKQNIGPVIPSTLKACTDELIRRIQSGTLQILPFTLSILNSYLVETQKSNKEEIEHLINRLEESKTNTTKIQNKTKQITECITQPTHIVLAGWIQYLQKNSSVTLTYPENGWIILAPSYLQSKTFNQSRYLDEVNVCLNKIQSKSASTTIIFVHTMKTLAHLLKQNTDNFRSQLETQILTQLHLAQIFGPYLIKLKCTECNSEIDQSTITHCNMCNFVDKYLAKPYTVHIVDRLLKYVAPDFWDDLLNNKKPNELINSNYKPNEIHNEIKRFYCHKDVPKTSLIKTPDHNNHPIGQNPTNKIENEEITDKSKEMVCPTPSSSSLSKKKNKKKSPASTKKSSANNNPTSNEGSSDVERKSKTKSKQSKKKNKKKSK